MLKLKELLKLNSMTYSDKITDKHQKKINMKTEIITEVIVGEVLPPENSSRESLRELNWLLEYNDGFIDRSVVDEGDDVRESFKKYCNDNGLPYDEDYYKKIVRESTKIIMSLKYKYNRPRPFQLAEFYGIEDFKIHNLDSAKTPSYPSGHTTQGYLLGYVLGHKYPNHYDEFMKLSKFVSESRLMARAHFPSDVSFGEKVAKLIFNNIKGKVK
jgi:acid phosphatase (class A)